MNRATSGGIADVSRPGGPERLGLDGSRRDPLHGGHQPAPVLPLPHEPRVGPLKRLERYVSAFFKLGRTARQAKSANHAVRVLEPRVDGLRDALDDALTNVLGELSDRTGDIDTRVEEAANGFRGEIDGMRGMIGSLREAMAEVSGRIDPVTDRQKSLLRRIETLEGSIDRLNDHLEDHVRAQADHLRGDLNGLRSDLDGVRGELDRVRDALGGATDRLADRERDERVRHARLASDQAQLARAYSDLSRRFDLMRFGGEEARSATPPGPPPDRREGLDALLDAFYNRLEDRFRGTRADIKERLRIYLPEVQAAAERTGLPVADLGCGRGEWVELLGEESITAFGIDLNPVQIADAQALGLDVREGDALAWLAEAPDASRSVITAHHLVEHLPFETVTWMTREALRVLAPGGVLIYETPNARNLIVGATTFHIDPTHRRPLPAEVLTTLLDTCGYHPVEARPLHPSDTLEVFNASARADPHVSELLFGPQDLAVLGTRPGGG